MSKLHIELGRSPAESSTQARRQPPSRSFLETLARADAPRRVGVSVSSVLDEQALTDSNIHRLWSPEVIGPTVAAARKRAVEGAVSAAFVPETPEALRGSVLTYVKKTIPRRQHEKLPDIPAVLSVATRTELAVELAILAYRLDSSIDAYGRAAQDPSFLPDLIGGAVKVLSARGEEKFVD